MYSVPQFIFDNSLGDSLLQGAYRTFVVNAKFMSPANLPHINFMASCVVEIFGLDSAAAYEHAFGYLRQLAVLVKNAQSQKSKEAFREVYCWQTVNSLELWAKLLSTHSDKEVSLQCLTIPFHILPFQYAFANRDN